MQPRPGENPGVRARTETRLTEPQQVVFDTIRMLLERKDLGTGFDASSVVADLGLQSLDLAELSATLEDELGRDPYSEGVLPRTVGEIVDW